MLTIKKLQCISSIINIKELCREAQVSYDNIISKIYRNRINPQNGELNVDESIKLTDILKKYDLLNSQ